MATVFQEQRQISSFSSTILQSPKRLRFTWTQSSAVVGYSGTSNYVPLEPKYYVLAANFTSQINKPIEGFPTSPDAYEQWYANQIGNNPHLKFNLKKLKEIPVGSLSTVSTDIINEQLYNQFDSFTPNFAQDMTYGVYPVYAFSGNEYYGELKINQTLAGGQTTGTGIADAAHWSHNSVHAVGSDFVQFTSDNVTMDYASVLSRTAYTNDWETLEFEFELKVTAPDGSAADEFYIGLADESVTSADSPSSPSIANKWYWNKGVSLWLDYWSADDAIKFGRAKANTSATSDSASNFEWRLTSDLTSTQLAAITGNDYRYYKVVFEKTNYNTELNFNNGKATLYFKYNEGNSWTEWATFTQPNAFSNIGNSFIAFGSRTGAVDSDTFLRNVTIKFNGGDTEEGDDNTNTDGDTSFNGGNICIGAGAVTACKTTDPEDVPTEIVITDPDAEIIAIIPIIGAEPNTVITFRKQDNRFYLLQDGKIIWTYLLSPFQLRQVNSFYYIGWYAQGTKTPVYTPPEYLVQRTFPATYVLDAVIEEPGYSRHPMVDGYPKSVAQRLIIFPDNTYYIDRISNEEDMKNAIYTVESGRNYLVEPNHIEPSPILPAWVVNLIGQTDDYIYLKEVQLDS